MKKLIYQFYILFLLTSLYSCSNQTSQDWTYIFDGKTGPYKEEDVPLPLSSYGKTKLEAEKIIKNHNSDNLIIRGNVLSGFPWNLIIYSFSENLGFVSFISLIGTYSFNLLTISFFSALR